MIANKAQTQRHMYPALIIMLMFMLDAVPSSLLVKSISIESSTNGSTKESKTPDIKLETDKL